MTEKFYPITFICKDDIRMAFREREKDKLKLAFIERKINKLNDSDMKYLASKITDDFLGGYFWDVLTKRFENLFLRN